MFSLQIWIMSYYNLIFKYVSYVKDMFDNETNK